MLIFKDKIVNFPQKDLCRAQGFHNTEMFETPVHKTLTFVKSKKILFYFFLITLEMGSLHIINIISN